MVAPQQFNITPRRYPIGDSSFPSIRRENRVYVDKTGVLYKLAYEGKYYFLSRPRRFGKSLMLSTLKAYFEGKRELFEGLAIEQLESEWRHHPVINFSMGGKNFDSIDELKVHLNAILRDCESDLGLTSEENSPEIRFKELIKNAYSKYGERVVILIDEYDKPILDTRHLEDNLNEGIKSLLRGFYGCIKESADYIRFTLITGVTKFSHVNIFSGLNNLDDISLDPAYNDICGISESEMQSNFKEDFIEFANRNQLSTQEAVQEFKLHYDGYLFASHGENIYNPFSVINAFAKMRFGSYWYQSGTSFYLIKELERSNFDFQSLEGTTISESEIMGTRASSNNIVALLYQAGYLTIKGYEPESMTYTLGFPNKEVSAGFFKNLLEALPIKEGEQEFSAASIMRAAVDGEPEQIMRLLKIALSQYNYEQLDSPKTEKHFVLLLFTICKAMGLNVESEMHTSRGRIDMVIKTRRYIYVMEFKINSYPKRAMQQINDKGYDEKFNGDSRRIFKIGANFSTKTRSLTGWIIE